MADDLNEWAHSTVIKPRIIASSSIEEFKKTCNEHELWYANWARFPIVYHTIKAFPAFNERKDCQLPQISKLSEFITGFEIKPGPNSKPSPPGIFFWDDDKNERFIRNKSHFLDQIFVSTTPEFGKFFSRHGGTCLRAINRVFGDQDYWVAIFIGQKYGSDLLVTYLDARTEFFDLSQKSKA